MKINKIIQGLVLWADMFILYDRAQNDKQNSEETTLISCSIKGIVSSFFYL